MRFNRQPSTEDSTGRMQPLQPKQASVANAHSQNDQSPVATDRSSFNPTHFEFSFYLPNHNLQSQQPGPIAQGVVKVDPTRSIPCEIRRHILGYFASGEAPEEESRVTIAPASMAWTSVENTQPLIYISTHSVLKTCRTLRTDFQNCLEVHTREGKIDRVSFRVLNFDFSAIIDSFFAKIKPEARAGMRRHIFKFKLIFDTNFVTRSSTWNGYSDQYASLDSEEDSLASAKAKRVVAKWLRFLVQERAAGRTMSRISYECIEIGNTEDGFRELWHAICGLNENMDAGHDLLSLLRACKTFRDDR